MGFNTISMSSRNKQDVIERNMEAIHILLMMYEI